MKLAAKLALLFLAVGLIPTLTVSWLTYLNNVQTLTQSTSEHLLEISNLKESEFRRWLTSTELILESIATRSMVRELSASLSDTAASFASKSALREAVITDHLSPHIASGLIESLSILHPTTGQILASTESTLVGRFRESENFYLEGRAATYIGRVAYSVSHESLVMHASTPIFTPSGDLAGVLAAHVDLAELSHIIAGDIEDHGRASEDIYLVNDFSFFVTEPRYGEAYALRRKIDTFGVAEALGGHTGVAEYTDYRGIQVIGAYRWLGDLNMGLLAEVDRSEALAPIRELQRTIAILLALSACALAGTAYFLAKGITRPINRLMNGAQEIGSGNLAFRVRERGRDELSRLSRSFNRMGESLLSVTASRDDLEREVTARTAAEISLKQSVNALERSEAKFRLLTDASPVGVFIFKDMILKYVNPAFERTFGYTRSELVDNLGPMDITHPDDHETAGAYIGQCIAGVEGLAPSSFIGVRKDGTLVYCEAMARPIDFEGGPALLGTITDVTARRETEAELRLKNTVFEASMAATSTADTAGLITLANPSFVKLWGYETKEEIIGRPLSDFIADPNEAFAIVTALNETGEWEGDFIAKRGDGSTFISNGHATVIRDEAGELVGYQSANLDVTTQRKAEEDIRRSKEITDSIIDSLPGAFYEISTGSRFLRWNNTFEKVTGYTSDEISKMSPFDLFEEHEKEKVGLAIGSVFTEGAADVTAGFRNKNGATIPYYFTGMLKVLDGEPVLIGMGTDITSLRRAETAVRESEEKFRSLVETTSDWLWEINQDMVYTYASPRIQDLLGYDPEEVIGKTPFELMAVETRDVAQTALREIVNSQQPFSGRESIHLHKDGHRVVLETSGRPITSPSGELLGYRGIDRDITERKAAEVKLDKLLDELQRSNKELEQFAYVASHDLQEPLRMVSSYTQLLERRYSDALDDDAHDFINYAVDGASRMQRLISDLLDFSRVQTRGKPFERVDLNSVLGRARHNLTAAIDESLALITNDELPDIMADENQLISVFQNLVANAVKFRGDQTPQIHISVEDRESEWLISVEDNGIGIDSEFRDRIFVIFQRLHGRDEYSGTGIGLAMCKRIVERHGGRIWMESTPSEGTTFFTMPKRQQEAD